jgi:hypothetical protein
MLSIFGDFLSYSGFIPSYFEKFLIFFRIVQLLISAGADINAGDEFSSAFAVAESKQIHYLEGLSSNFKKRSDLLCFFGKLRCFLVLMEREEEFSSRLNMKSSFKGCTALHYAVLANDFTTIQVACAPSLNIQLLIFSVFLSVDFTGGWS